MSKQTWCSAAAALIVAFVATGYVLADYEAVGSNPGKVASAQDPDIYAKAEMLPVTDPDDPQGDWSVAAGNARATNWGNEPQPSKLTQGEAKFENHPVKAGWNNPPLHPGEPPEPDPEDPDPPVWKWLVDAREDFYPSGSGGSRVAVDPATTFSGDYEIKVTSIELKVNGVVFRSDSNVTTQDQLRQNDDISVTSVMQSKLTGGAWNWESTARIGPIVEARCLFKVVSKWKGTNMPQTEPPVIIFHKLVKVGTPPAGATGACLDLSYNVKCKKPQPNGVE